MCARWENMLYVFTTIVPGFDISVFVCKYIDALVAVVLVAAVVNVKVV